MNNQSGLLVVNTHRIQLLDVIDFYSKVDMFSIFIETTFLNKQESIYIGISAYGRTDVFIINHPNGEFVRWDIDNSTNKKTPVFDNQLLTLSLEETLSTLKPLFFSDKLKIGYNIKLDIKNILHFYNADTLPQPYFDIMLAEYTINNSSRNIPSLVDCGKKHLLIEKFPELTVNFNQTSYSEMTQYIGFRAETIFKLYYELKPYLENNLKDSMDMQTQLLNKVLLKGAK
jgi:DNA polymerase I-like protein with 3'-5' exonuclease and polymerase domains